MNRTTLSRDTRMSGATSKATSMFSTTFSTNTSSDSDEGPKQIAQIAPGVGRVKVTGDLVHQQTPLRARPSISAAARAVLAGRNSRNSPMSTKNGDEGSESDEGSSGDMAAPSETARDCALRPNARVNARAESNKDDISATTHWAPQHSGGLLCKLAAAGEASRCRELLLAGEARVSERDGEGRTALYLAAMHQHPDTCTALLTSRADPDEVSDGETALGYAARTGDRAVTTLLLQLGASTKVRNKDGLTPLLAAAYNGHVKTCVLIGRWLNLKPHHEEGMAAMAVAAVQAHMVVFRVLKAMVKLGFTDGTPMPSDYDVDVHIARACEEYEMFTGVLNAASSVTPVPCAAATPHTVATPS